MSLLSKKSRENKHASYIRPITIGRVPISQICIVGLIPTGHIFLITKKRNRRQYPSLTFTRINLRRELYFNTYARRASLSASDTPSSPSDSNTLTAFDERHVVGRSETRDLCCPFDLYTVDKLGRRE